MYLILLHFTLDMYLILLTWYVPYIAQLYPWYVPYIAVGKEVSITIFKVFGMTWTGIEPSLPDQWRTLYLLDA